MIKKRIRVSDSRMSVLKSLPVIKEEIEKWRKIEEEKYRKAVEVFAGKAEKVAKVIVEIAENKDTADIVRLNASNVVLDRLKEFEERSNGGSQQGEVLTFEQMLKVTRTVGSGSTEERMEVSKKEIEELSKDFINEPDVDKLVMKKVEEKSIKVESKRRVSRDKDKGKNKKGFMISPRLKELLNKSMS